MNIPAIISNGQRVISQNSPLILTALGVSGAVTTAYLTGKASWEAGQIIQLEEWTGGTADSRKERFKERSKLVWKFYIPPAISGIITVGCIVASARVSSNRAAAAYSVLAISEKAFDEYKEKVVEKLGEKKEKAVRDELAQDRITKNPPEGLVVAGSGNVLCCELFTGRYFNCDMETLRKTQNDINAKLMANIYVTLSDFYYIVGLPYTTHSSQIGWESDRQLALEFSTVMSDDNRPCIAFDYNYTKNI